MIINILRKQQWINVRPLRTPKMEKGRTLTINFNVKQVKVHHLRCIIGEVTVRLSKVKVCIAVDVVRLT